MFGLKRAAMRVKVKDMVFFVDGKEVSAEQAKNLLSTDVDDMKLVEKGEKTEVQVKTKRHTDE